MGSRSRNAAFGVLVLLIAAVVAALATDSGDTTSPGRRPAAYVDQSPRDIFLTGVADLSKIRTAKVQASFSDGGDYYVTDVVADRKGTCYGRVTYNDAAGDLVVDDGVAYVRGDFEFFVAVLRIAGVGQAQALRLAARIGDRWVAAPTNSEIQQGCDLDKTLASMGKARSELERETEGVTPMTKGPVTTVYTAPSVEVDFTDDAGSYSVWFAVDAPHYLTRLIVDADIKAELVLSEINEPLKVHLPSKDELVNPSQLQALLGTQSV